ncbi:hypothetical protein KLER11_gp49 [Pararheinheimera phage vB_PsoM_KLER1-1]|nr:hypothetical protein KLER11_gp49 [Pararheinheimera phage vB_PsoM_KLER1-1]
MLITYLFSMFALLLWGWWIAKSFPEDAEVSLARKNLAIISLIPVLNTAFVFIVAFQEIKFRAASR